MLPVGLAYIPQHHSVFSKPPIAENLRMGGYLLTDAKPLQERVAKVQDTFPILGTPQRICRKPFRQPARRLAETGKGILMVEQNVKKALQASDRGYVLELGQVRITDDAQALIVNRLRGQVG
jgi:branched-chain amino acid transport system ATP-binding protein